MTQPPKNVSVASSQCIDLAQLFQPVDVMVGQPVCRQDPINETLEAACLKAYDAGERTTIGDVIEELRDKIGLSPEPVDPHSIHPNYTPILTQPDGAP